MKLPITKGTEPGNYARSELVHVNNIFRFHGITLFSHMLGDMFTVSEYSVGWKIADSPVGFENAEYAAKDKIIVAIKKGASIIGTVSKGYQFIGNCGIVMLPVVSLI